jgi:hypothetical protein
MEQANLHDTYMGSNPFYVPPTPHTHVKGPGGLLFRGKGGRHRETESVEKNYKKEIRAKRKSLKTNN